MKTSGSFLKSLLIVTICLSLGSCQHGNNELDSFIIKVDRIQIPTSIVAGTPFEIEFFGTIGTNGCASFGEFVQSTVNNEITIEARGLIDSNSRACPTVMVYLDGEKLPMTISIPGNYVIKIKQPDNTYLEQQLTVI